ncbi:MAG: RNA polymerase Rpb4 family protein [Halobacteria archaeon]
MIVKEKLDDEYVSVAEVKELLNELANERGEEDREMSFELRKSIDNINEIAKLDIEDVEELYDELVELESVDPFTGFKIVDLLPENRDELRAIYAKERYSLDGDELDEILNLVAKYR